MRKGEAPPRRSASVLVTHAHPDVGVDGVGTVPRPWGSSVRSLPAHPRAPAVRRGDPHLDPGQGAEDRQRAGDVVAVADVGELQALEAAEALLQRQQVGQRLAGVMGRGERVYHRHGKNSASSEATSCEPERIAIACT